MDKTAIKNFSIWARNKLIADITYKAGLLGINESEIKDALPQSTKDAEFYDIGTKEPYSIHGDEIKQRKELVAAIKKKSVQLDYKDAYRNVIEEVAYTWFNRLIAIRFMEVNDYMPSHIRVLSSEGAKKLEPDLVTTPFDAEIDFSTDDTEKIMQMKNDNQVDELFRFLFIKQCNALNDYLPKLFEKTSDYTELLLNVSVTDQDGIVFHLTHDIKEDDFNISNAGEDGKPTGQVEIIGWMYQYYNTEPKDEAFALLKSNVKISKERIPAATQLFTPDWIVRYMVENSVGRLWLEGHENETLQKQWKYYLDEAEQEPDVIEQLKEIRDEYNNIKPEEIKVIDPCMGSGHILVYAFDVLMQIYESYGYSQRDAAKSIVENNIYGLDIDDRAFQLSYFAIMMKARSYNRRFLTMEIEPNVCAIQESTGLQYDKNMGDFLLGEEHRETLQYLLKVFTDAKEYGSIIHVEKHDYDGFLHAWKMTAEQTAENILMLLWYTECDKIVSSLAMQAKILSEKYDVVITNPPYMGNGNMNEKLSEYVKQKYPLTKFDLSTIFMEKTINICKSKGFISMINIPVWMFLSSYEKMRDWMMKKVEVVNLLHLGRGIFGADFGTTSFVLSNHYLKGYKGIYERLFDKQSSVDNIELKEQWFHEQKGKYISKQDDYCKIPGTPMAYWLGERMMQAFNNPSINEIGGTKQGLATGDNNRFLRLWYEVENHKIGFGLSNRKEAEETGLKWFPCNKGGAYRKWYGNNDYIVNWMNDGVEIRNFRDENGKLRSRPQNMDYYFREGITWSTLSIGQLSMRYSPKGNLFETKGSVCFFDSDEDMYYVLGLMNSKVVYELLQVLCPTVDFHEGPIGRIPVIKSEKYKEKVIDLVKENIELSYQDWSSNETSWEFRQNPIISMKKSIVSDDTNVLISSLFDKWKESCENRRLKLQSNEEELNKIFIEIYGLSSDIEPLVSEKDIVLNCFDRKNETKKIISYAIGCLFGRYSTDREGLILADYIATHNETGVDEDNIIPITDEQYFEDDIVGLFCEWIKKEFGEEYYEKNLDYLATGLDEKGNTAKECLRTYFINNFFKDHSQTYSITGSGKRPIYWLFDSGRNNGFKALIYMHRYNADTIGNLRVDYLHRMERIYESEINRMQDTIDNSSNAREVTAASKRKEKLQKQLKECQEYDEKIGHLALSRIEIDLDDGVKVNYEKVQTANDGKKYQVLAKI